MCSARRITKASNTHTHSEYVILIAFPWQQYFCEHTSMLRYKYDACLVKPNNSQAAIVYWFNCICNIQLNHKRFFISLPVHHIQSITSLNCMLSNHKRLYTITKPSTLTNAYKNCRPEEKLFICNLFSNGISRLHYIALTPTPPQWLNSP